MIARSTAGLTMNRDRLEGFVLGLLSFLIGEAVAVIIILLAK